jgi:hypothetical protein
MPVDSPVTQRPKIGIVFFGIPRSGNYCYPTIRKNVIDVACSVGDVRVRYHFFDQKTVFNPLSGENGPLPAVDYEPFLVHEGRLSDPSIIFRFFDIDKIASCGDAWGDGFVSTYNLLRQLYSLQCVTNQILPWGPDLVIFVRPDLIYHDSLIRPLLAALATLRSPIARLPSWHWASAGYNDRFAICTGRAIKAYGLRVQMVESFLSETGGPLHSELLLKYALECSLIFVRPFSQKASRVRIGGRVVKERFAPVSGSRKIRYGLREVFKFLLAHL